MRITTSVLTLLAALTAAAWGQSDACVPSMTRGVYSVSCSGYITPAPNAPLAPFSVLAIVTGDWAGNYSGTGKASIGGVVVDQSLEGKATLKNDCTGTITYKQTVAGVPGPNLNLVFHVLDNGKEMRGFSVDQGTVYSCSLKLISR